MLTLSTCLLEAMIDHARQSFPRECCGILGGIANQGTHVYRMKNVSPQPDTGYLMDAEEQFWVFRNLRHNALQFVSVYHSHPFSAAYPSSIDVASAHYEDVYYPIVSLAQRDKPEIGVFRIVSGQIKNAELRIV
jgi:proteasome lid subunit RPN8/RPN11